MVSRRQELLYLLSERQVSVSDPQSTSGNEARRGSERASCASDAAAENNTPRRAARRTTRTVTQGRRGSRSALFRTDFGRPSMATRRKFSGTNLRARREAAGFHQTTLAQQVGVAPCSVSSWETGRRAPFSPVLLQLAEVLDCEVGDLFEAVAE
ncbi:helix-turn-helix domain-containing protein [Micromonospora arida]|uniref:helix-turn-helix domain-containing protein n=1 Tax=Micromonospora arida TaxID=2203715 RepID=UPI0036A5C092